MQGAKNAGLQFQPGIPKGIADWENQAARDT
jgi:hypothetical protein